MSLPGLRRSLLVRHVHASGWSRWSLARTATSLLWMRGRTPLVAACSGVIGHARKKFRW